MSEIKIEGECLDEVQFVFLKEKLSFSESQFFCQTSCEAGDLAVPINEKLFKRMTFLRGDVASDGLI